MSNPNALPDDDRIVFRSERPSGGPEQALKRPAWRVLAIDDDADFQASVCLSLRDAEILDRPIELVTASSMSEAARLLARDRDFAVILVDVVMESDDAGLRLVRGIREMLGLFEPRIVLLTGQAGFAPVDDVMTNYDLTDYCLKSDLASRGLKNILTAAIRGYHQLTTISAARKGLQLILEASNRFSSARTLPQMATAALAEVATLLGIPEEGIVAVEGADEDIADIKRRTRIVGTAGRFSHLIDGTLDDLPERSIANALGQALAQRFGIQTSQYQVLYIPRQHAMADFAIYVATGRPLDDSEQQLLSVFGANASKGFSNVALISRLDRMAYEDDLLHIPNRNGLLREIDRLRSGHYKGPVHQLLMIDLDNFAGLNEAFGVHVGNQMLRSLLPALASHFPPPCVIGRITADLFAVIGPPDFVSLDKERELDGCELIVENQRFHCSACAVLVPIDAVEGDPADLLRAAKAMMRVAKRQGSGTRLPYDPSIDNKAGARFELMARLLRAIDNDELRLHFQPLVSLADGKVVGAEALLRWRSGDTFIPPGEFIPLAEKSAHILTIGNLVMRKACDAVKALDAAGLPHMQVSINISTRQLADAHFIERTLALARNAGVSPARIKLEVTETGVMEHLDQMSAVLERLREAGFKIAIDDFGTGQASLEYIHTLPADQIKLDMTFVRRIGSHDRSEAITQIMLALGAAIETELVAEGVETAAQAHWLKANGCQLAQGWHFGRPMPLDDFIAHCQAGGA